MPSSSRCSHRCVAQRGHAARRPSAPPPRPVRHRRAAHPATPHAPVACHARRRARHLLRTGTPARPARPVGLHRVRRTWRRDRRRRVPAPAVPVRARPLGLASCRDQRRRRELHRAVCRAAGRAVAPGRRARGAPHRQPVGRLQQPRRARDADPPLRRPACVPAAATRASRTRTAPSSRDTTRSRPHSTRRCACAAAAPSTIEQTTKRSST